MEFSGLKGARVLVTGVAGFIGSKVADLLLQSGVEVVGIDCFLDESYSKHIKISRLQPLLLKSNFVFYEFDMRKDDFSVLPSGISHVINEAAMPGLMKSWSDLGLYLDSNILTVGRLLQAMARWNITKFIQISTSSVYGQNAIGDESSTLAPVSPYGVSKLAAENLVHAYSKNYQIPYSILRYFSVYGPGQRPDMGYSIFIDHALRNKEITIFGDGTQRRTNTYIDDCALGTVQALEKAKLGETYNLSGNHSISVNEVISIIETQLGKPLNITFKAKRPGDQFETNGDSSKASSHFNFNPRTAPALGLLEQFKAAKISDQAN